ncbi:SGNH/GDSL hydrolase family protein [Novipirellula sp.]|uniref:SGNH/GDSL hydrolase family protein n=1 Tax=Novipirellula sp. TaxID=2795430 RepID=UPI00356A73C4
MKDTHATNVADGKSRSLALKRFFQGATAARTGALMLCAVLFLTTMVGASAQELASQEELYTGKEFSNAFANPQDDPDLPNVLLIGDSISIGYTVDVRKRLSGKADVFRIPSNGKYAAFGSENLAKWLGQRKWDVIHFNWGLWDICYRNPKSKTQGHRDKVDGTLTASPDQYRESLQQIVARLKQTDATLIWCATTPVPEFEAGRKEGDEIKYNLIAESIMKKNGIRINDLHAHALRGLPEIQKQKGDVHFTSQGYAYLAEKVALEIASALSVISSEKKK